VPDDRRRADAEVVEQVAQQRGVCTERVVADRLGGLAVAQQVGRDDGVPGRQPVDELAPAAGVASMPWTSTSGGPSPATTTPICWCSDTASCSCGTAPPWVTCP
jgi:hypothetical protein